MVKGEWWGGELNRIYEILNLELRNSGTQELRNSGKEGRGKSHAAVAEERKGHSGFRFERSEKAWDARTMILKFWVLEF
jgi:hypothetical protein